MNVGKTRSWVSMLLFLGPLFALAGEPGLPDIPGILHNGGSLEYDAIGDVEASIDRNGARTRYLYDDDGNLTQAITPSGDRIDYHHQFNDRLNIAKTTDSLGQITEYTYAPDGGLWTGTLLPDGSQETVAYEGSPQVVTYSVTRIDTQGDRSVSTFDTDGRLTEATDQQGQSTHFSQAAVLLEQAFPNEPNRFAMAADVESLDFPADEAGKRGDCKGGYRQRLERAQPVPKEGGPYDAHHTFPCALSGLFRGIVDVNNPDYLVWWNRADHKKYWSDYNELWRTWFKSYTDQGTAPTSRQVLIKGRWTLRFYGLKPRFKAPPP